MSDWLRFRLRLDRVLAALLALVTAPLVAILAVVVRVAEGRPALIRVPRIGVEGHEFGMWKVRTLRADNASGLASGPSLTSGSDNRVTATGRILRRARLDELPQLWNVVTGEMALLGPRPEAPSYVDGADERWVAVLRMPPGITGVTQLLVDRWERAALHGDDVEERYRADILPVKLELDQWYLTHASPALDLSVALATVGRIFGSPTTRRLERRVGVSLPELTAESET